MTILWLYLSLKCKDLVKTFSIFVYVILEVSNSFETGKVLFGLKNIWTEWNVLNKNKMTDDSNNCIYYKCSLQRQTIFYHVVPLMKRAFFLASAMGT